MQAKRCGACCVGLLALVLVGASVGAVARKPALVIPVSRDTATNTGFQHETEVEPSIASAGSVLVTVFQVGRGPLHGAAATGWATSRNGGKTWRRGLFQAITRPGVNPPTAIDITDPVVSYDAVHRIWIAASIADFANGSRTLQVHRSRDGLHWSAPVEVAKGVVDKDWLVCDEGARSRFRGRCYVAFTREDVERLGVRWSGDGGATWSAETPIAAPLGVPTAATPAVRPDGGLVVVFRQGGSGRPDQVRALTFSAVRSADGGQTFGPPSAVDVVRPYFERHLRALPSVIPSIVVDARGRLYAVWQSCRFRKQCDSNDLVLSISANGSRWSKPRRLPLGRRGHHVIPGLGIAQTRPGLAVRLGLVYVNVPTDRCAPAKCRLEIFFTESTNGGRTWTRPLRLTGQMRFTWLAQAPPGQTFAGDYTATTFIGATAWSAFSIASPPTRGRLHQRIAVARIRPADLPR
jgi:hypothetical protein